MRQDVMTQERAARFLLGKLTEGQRAEIEEAFFADDELFERILAAEDELIDAYVRRDLPAADRERFEETLPLSPDRRQRVRFAVALRKHFAHDSETPAAESNPSGVSSRFKSFLSRLAAVNPPMRLSLATAMSLLVAVGVWWLIPTSKPSPDGSAPAVAESSPPPRASDDEPERQGADSERVAEGGHAPDATSTEKGRRELGRQPRPQPRRTTPVVASFILSQGLVRDAEEATPLILPGRVGTVRLQMNFEPGGYSDYQARLETVEGREVWNQKRLKHRRTAAGNTVTVGVPSEKIPAGDYVLTLSGKSGEGVIERVSDYSFRVVMKQPR